MSLLRRAFASMGCPCSIQVERPDPTLAAQAVDAAVAEVHRLDRKYSHYREDTLLAAWCASAGHGQWLELDAESAALLDLAALLHAQSDGRFDITTGALTRLWDRPQGGLPPLEEIEAARQRAGWHQHDWRRPRLRLRLPGLRLDLGGLVKEYARNICRRSLRAPTPSITSPLRPECARHAVTTSEATSTTTCWAPRSCWKRP